MIVIIKTNNNIKKESEDELYSWNVFIFALTTPVYRVLCKDITGHFICGSARKPDFWDIFRRACLSVFIDENMCVSDYALLLCSLFAYFLLFPFSFAECFSHLSILINLTSSEYDSLSSTFSLFNCSTYFPITHSHTQYNRRSFGVLFIQTKPHFYLRVVCFNWIVWQHSKVIIWNKTMYIYTNIHITWLYYIHCIQQFSFEWHNIKSQLEIICWMNSSTSLINRIVLSFSFL